MNKLSIIKNTSWHIKYLNGLALYFPYVILDSWGHTVCWTNLKIGANLLVDSQNSNDVNLDNVCIIGKVSEETFNDGCCYGGLYIEFYIGDEKIIVSYVYDYGNYILKLLNPLGNFLGNF